MKNTLNVKINANGKQNTITCPFGTTADTLTEHFGVDIDSVAAVRVNNAIRPLRTRLLVNCTLEPVLLESREGIMLYRRSLSFLLAIAARKLFSDRRLYVGHSLGRSYYYTFASGEKPTEAEVAALQSEMKRLVEEDLPITFGYLAYEEALEVFKKNNQTDTVLLLEQRSESRVKIIECENFTDLYIEPLVSRTGLLSAFELQCYQDGFLLRFPAFGGHLAIAPFKDEPQLFKVYHEYKEWGRMIGVRVVGELNARVMGKGVRDYIRIVEAYQSRKLGEIAEQIYAKRDTLKMVLLAGPSSSGKTTSAKRLCIELMVMGFKPIAIGLDNYYLNHDKTPLDEKGDPDYECLEALDVPYLNEQLKALYRGEEVCIPIYDFKTGSRRETGTNIRMEDRTILIVEGIHALNDALTPSIARDTKFKLYVSALTQLNLDDHNRISTSDNRLLRRIVRDNQFRAKDAAGTLKMWPSVQAGERKHIFPFQNTADTAFNSAIDYELSVLKYYADPLLRAVKPGMYEHAEAVRLLSFLENFAPIPPQYVPGASILREFIGDSEFKY